ncbi:hypothetical protein [Bradymonas sediminis]|uniref:Uncharacterized protein n=1 Tax=Bradymonas sediminis TaxID=1548548 RepID=A0A2Z4FPL4_9DELT|nr:hypothetical protein [Bradymonas sediminis]AWV90991.1 hypothetical protein DN745_17325 [Bradymonas sediminis]TDP75268.1 hypothetical protein DFR33_104133 [Bradymonas sediminis]
MSRPRAQLQKRLLLLAALTLLAPSTGCDQARLNTNAPHAQATSFQPKTLRTLLSQSGVERLLEDEYRQGISLANSAQQANAYGLELSIGPIAQDFAVDNWQVQSAASKLDISIESSPFFVTIPLRVRDASLGSHATRICRFNVSADQAIITAEATLDSVPANGSGSLPFLSPTTTPDVALSAAKVEAIAACPPIDGLEAGKVDAIHQNILAYFEQTLADSTAAAIALSPVESLGLLYTPAAVARVSNFPNRRGELWANGRMNAAGVAGAEVNGDGLVMDMDIALNSKRAGCAPALVPEAPAADSAGPLTQNDLAGAHAALAIATPLLARMAQASVSAGFACRGLEDSSIEADARSLGLRLSTQDLNLAALGLADLDLGPNTSALLIAGTLPTVSTDPANAALLVNWPQLTVDLYAEIQGVRVRILELRADLEMSLHLQTQGWGITQSEVRFTVNALELSNLSIESHWSSADLSDADSNPELRRWTQRALLLILEDFFHFPLPLMPNSSLRLEGAQVRSADLLLRFKFDRIF